jgi:hypothetical protein
MVTGREIVNSGLISRETEKTETLKISFMMTVMVSAALKPKYINKS